MNAQAAVEQFSGPAAILETREAPPGAAAARFALLRGCQRSPRRFDTAVEQVFAGIAAGSIRNTVLQEANRVLSRAVDDAWTQCVGEPYFHAGQWQRQPEAVQALYEDITLMGLHSVFSACKKVGKCRASGPALDAMRAFCAEALPLAEAVASLKDKAVKGRAPGTERAKAENPNKIVRTCAVCFRAIAVVHGTMAHHGYRRPALGFQTASCPGVRFQPLEVSSEGLRWLIDLLDERLAARRRALAQPPEFLMARPVPRGPLEKIGRDNALWPRALDRHEAELRGEIGALEREIPMLERRLAEWTPTAG